MPRANPIQPSFARGELSPLLHGRIDLAPYAVAAKTILNGIVRVQGPVTRRSGTRFVAEVKDSAAPVRLISFEFSTAQAYVIETGEKYLRAYMNEGRIEIGATDAAIANGTFDAGLSGWTNVSTGTGSIAHDSANGRMSLTPGGAGASDVGAARQAVAVGATYQTLSHVVKFRVLGAAGDKLRLRVGTSAGGTELVNDRECRVGWHTVAFTPGAATVHLEFRALGADRNKTVQLDDAAFLSGVALELATPYAAADLLRLKFAQSADTMYFAHPAYAPRKFTRTGHTSWSLVEVDQFDGPFLDENTETSKTLQPSATTGNGITITAAGHAPFAATDVGRLVRIKGGSTWGHARIVGHASSTQVTADVKSAFAGVAAVAQWRLGAWSATTGYPGAVTFYEERLWWAGSTANPQTVWSSRSGEFESHAPTDADGTVVDDHAVSFTLAANQVNVIRWLHPGPILQIGTVGGLWVLRATALDQPITPTNVQARQQRAQGCADVAPREAGDAVLFVTRSGRKIRELAYSFERDKYVAPDMTILAEHVGRSGFVAMDFAQEPDPVLWCVRADGMLLGMTYERDQEVIGWHRHVLGGAFGAGPPAVESATVVPSPLGDHSQLWLAVKRTVNGATRRYLEFMEEAFGGTQDQADAFFVDCGLTYSGAATTVVSGLGHLEGAGVTVLADGAAHPAKTVAGGQILLDRPAAKVHVGLPYDTDIELLRLEAGGASGTAQGQTRRIAGVTLRFMDTLGCRVGPDPSRLDEVLFRDAGAPMDRPPPLFTGDKYLAFAGGHDTDGFVFVRQSQPLPMTLQAVMPRLVTTER